MLGDLAKLYERMRPAGSGATACFAESEATKGGAGVEARSVENTGVTPEKVRRTLGFCYALAYQEAAVRNREAVKAKREKRTGDYNLHSCAAAIAEEHKKIIERLIAEPDSDAREPLPR